MSEVEFAEPRAPGRPVRNGQSVDYGSDEDLSVQFYLNPVTEKDHVRIAFPGDKHSMFDQPVQDKHKIRFARLWEQYQSGAEAFEGQTRLEDVPWIDEAMRNEYRALNIHTVEQLASVTDGNLQAVGMGARKMRERAQRHLEEQKAAIEKEARSKAREEMAIKEQAWAQEREAMQTQLDEMRGMVESLAEKKKGK